MLIKCERVANRLMGLCPCGPNRWRSTLNLRKLSENKRIIIFASIWMSVLLISIIIKSKGVVAFLCSCAEIFPGYEDSPNFSSVLNWILVPHCYTCVVKHKDTLWINYIFAMLQNKLIFHWTLDSNFKTRRRCYQDSVKVSFILRE